MSKRNKNIFIIHFQPLERYPPVMNLINYFRENSPVEVNVISTRNNKAYDLKTFNPGCKNIKIKRTAAINPGSFFRIFNYLYFYSYSLYLLSRHRPNSVLYFETISSWPALMYKKLRGEKVKLFVHYHEYSTPAEYNNNMKLVKWMHRIETQLYSWAYEWISHTNQMRMQMFKNDNYTKNIVESVLHIIPNYPSKSWFNFKEISYSKNQKIRLVYVGSLGYKNMYLQEVIDWLGCHQQEFSLDIFSYNINIQAKEALKNCTHQNIKYSGGCDYETLPKILKQYDVGLVIYKPFSENTIQAVSNKVFEYLACGLDVWFSEDMTYTFKYITKDTYPKVLPLNFKKLELFNYKSALSREGLIYKSSDYFYENVYDELVKVMI